MNTNSFLVGCFAIKTYSACLALAKPCLPFLPPPPPLPTLGVGTTLQCHWSLSSNWSFSWVSAQECYGLLHFNFTPVLVFIKPLMGSEKFIVLSKFIEDFFFPLLQSKKTDPVFCLFVLFFLQSFCHFYAQLHWRVPLSWIAIAASLGVPSSPRASVGYGPFYFVCENTHFINANFDIR